MAFFVESEEEAKKIATVFSRILVAYEKLTKGQVVEATYEDLVGNAVGQSYQKTTEYIKKATDQAALDDEISKRNENLA